MLYMTYANHAEATRIARILVEEGLVACVNILQPMTSHYMWEGSMRESSEIPVFAKSLNSKFEQIVKRVTELHSYDVPCIVALNPQEVSNPYVAWLNTVIN
jgi:periplasmic divalent cation tolerance protein